jgi:GAF domain-containing protein
MLAQMTQRLFRLTSFEEAIQTILDDVIALHGAEYGDMQLPIGDELVIVAQRGLSADFLKTFRRVKKDDGCACGRALRLRQAVIIPDVQNDPEFVNFVPDANKAGFRAVQSTPFFTSDETLLGVVSTKFANIHQPTLIEMQTLEEYGVQASEYAFKLLGDIDLGTKAEKMSEDLYSRALAPHGFGLAYRGAQMQE